MHLYHFLALALVIGFHNGIVSSAPVDEKSETPDPFDEAIDQLIFEDIELEEESFTGTPVEEPLIVPKRVEDLREKKPETYNPSEEAIDALNALLGPEIEPKEEPFYGEEVDEPLIVPVTAHPLY